MARFRTWLACLMTVMLLLGSLPAYAESIAADDSAKGDDGTTFAAQAAPVAATAEFIRIKNKWQSNYLYESTDGIVRYGFTAVNDQSSQWQIVDENGKRRIQNRKTGHFITIVDVSKRRDALTSREVAATSASDQWYIETASRPGYVLIKSAAADSAVNLVIHEEDQLGFAEVSSDINVTFESPQWKLEPVEDSEPVRIINEERAGQALYVKTNPDKDRTADVAAFGQVDANDPSSHWYLEPGDNGNYRLKNRATGQYIVQFDGGDYWRAIEMGDSDDPLKLEWSIKPSVNLEDTPVPGFVTISSAFNGGYVLNTQFPTDSYARSNDWSNAKLANAHWKVVPAADMKPVRIVNFTTGNVGTDYLYEESGAVKHGALGAANADNLKYQWYVEDYNGTKRIRNAETGRYALAGDSLTMGDSTAASASSGQWQIAASLQYDDYVSIGSAAGGYLNVEAAADTAHVSGVDPNSDGAQWLLEDPAVKTNGSVQYIRIQNEWQPFVLYEDRQGNLKYGNMRDDQRDQWAIEKFNGRKRIKNRATGHYINLQSMKDGRIQVTDVQDDWRSAIWIIETVSGGSKLIHSVNDPSSGSETDRLINLQNLTKYAEYAVINRNWGSPKWKFINVVDDRPTNIRLVNKSGQSLYEEVSATDPTQGTVKYGVRDESDAASVWFIEDAGDNAIRLKNTATNHYITMQNVGDTDVTLDNPPEPLQTLETIYPTWGSAKWYMDTTQEPGYIALRSAWAQHYIKAEDPDSAAKVSKTVKAEDGSIADSALFSVVTATAGTPELPTGAIRIRNVFNQQYLYENKGGVVLYGNVDASNGYSHWLLEQSPDGSTRIVNRVTGDAMAMSGDYRYIEGVSTSGGTDSSSLWAIEPTPDGASSLIRSLNGSYDDEYMNVQNSAGYAERGLYPSSYGSLQWQFETAPTDFDTPSVDAARNDATSTPALPSRNAVRIAVPAAEAADVRYLSEANGAISLSADGTGVDTQWLAYDYNGRQLLQNKATGKLLTLEDSGSLSAEAFSNAVDVRSQWRIDEAIGYKTIRSASNASPTLTHSGGKAKAEENAAASDSRWTIQPIRADITYEAEQAFMGGGAQESQSTAGFMGTGYAEGLSKAGAKLAFAVHAPEAGSYQAAIRYKASGANAKLNVYVNGLLSQPIDLPASAGWTDAALTIELRAGINNVTVQYDSGSSGGNALIDSLTVKNSTAPDGRGATVPYTAYEAEQAVTNGTKLGPSRTYMNVASEASGRQAVRLDTTGQYVEFTTTEAINSIVVRFSMPDSSTGTGIDSTLGLYVNGEFRQKLNLSSDHAWEYGSYPWSNDPNQGGAHRFFDEAHALIGDVPAGATIRLEKDADSMADYYVVDLVELEQVAAPLEMPDGFVSLADYGAAPNDGVDDTASFQAALTAAQAGGTGLWIPQGEFELRGDQIVLGSHVTIRGAGMWYTQLTGARFMGKGSDIEVYDLLIDGDLNIRDDEAHTHAFEGAFGPGSVIQDVWIEHSKTGLWLTKLKDSEDYTDGLYMVGLRIRDLMADGINFCVGTSNSMMEQSDIRYPGDDGIAMWSAEGRASINNTARFNTVALPWLADNIVVFGGTSNKIQDNIARDTITNGAGIAVSTRFNPVPFAGTTIVERNTLIRTGSYDTGYLTDLGAIWVFASEKDLNGKVIIRNNVALDSTYLGLTVQGIYGVDNVSVEDLVIDGVGTKGVDVASSVSGKLVIDNVIVRNSRIAEVANNAAHFQLKEVNEGFANVVKPFSLKAADGTTGRFRITTGSSLAIQVLNSDGSDVTAQAQLAISGSGAAAMSGNGKAIVGQSAGEAVLTVTYNGAVRAYTIVVAPSAGSDNGGGGTITNPGHTGSTGSTGEGGVIVSGSAADNDASLAAMTGSTITFAVDSSGAAGQAAFTVQGLRAAIAAHPDGTIIVQNGGTSYELPLPLIADLLKGQSIPSDAVVTFTVKPLEVAAANKLAVLAKKQGLDLKGTLIDFGITLQANGKTMAIDSFGSTYVTRTLVIDGTLDPKTATALAYNEATGEFQYVPATFASSGGKTTVTIMSMGNSIYGVAVHPVTFGDVSTHWAKGWIEQLASRMIVKGVATSSFAPNRSITRAEFAALLVRALGLHEQSGGTSFSDVGANAWYAQDVRTASQFGLVQGMADGAFHPSDSITREQMAVMLAKAIAIVKGKQSTSGEAASASFSDASTIHGWASDAVALTAQLGIMQGNPSGEFAPRDLATRAEATVVIGRLLQAAGLMN
ncbi:S-layer homology domain-containing protein [Paenibacillus sp. PR3]|uniref:S-layer homology domain-containing protein n=1 Tax=Paenibacillus terricola TaxID=2763503 RepID=A0ABR8MVP7_9BACL|nr:S-layer homology domain-containing protein [Paenibacillus terricola]MBD3919983.1 S-layer homology domain-containing protein [Paenibacillus terricola]